MPFRPGSVLPLLAAALAAVAARAQTTPIQDLDNFVTDSDQYNVITFSTAATSVDLGSSNTVDGGIADEGGLTTGGTETIASSSWSGSNPSLYVSGALSFKSGSTTTLKNGQAAVSSSSNSGWSWSSPKLTEGSGSSKETLTLSASSPTDPLTNSGPSGWTWSTVNSDFTTIASGLAGDTTNVGTIAVSGGDLTFTAPGGVTSGVVVFDLDAADITGGDSYNGTSFTSISISVPSGVDYVIDVTGTSSSETLFGSSVSFGTDANQDQLLWNFESATGTLTLDTSNAFNGSILAPDATIVADSSVDGQVVADAFSTGSSVDLTDSAFTAVAVPEAPASAWCAAGLCAAAFALRRRLAGRRGALGG